MTTYNTGNPIGSTDARDLYDNAQNFDTAVNTSNPVWVDRFGVARQSLASAAGFVIDTPWLNDSDFATLAEADAAAVAANKRLTISTVWTVATATTITSAIDVLPGGGFSGSGAITIKGPFEAGLYQVFNGTNAVTFGAGRINGVYPEWWGAVPDYVLGGSATTDCTTAIQMAATAAKNTGITLVLSVGNYLISSGIVFDNISVICADPYYTLIVSKTELAPAIIIMGARKTIKNLSVWFDLATSATYAVGIQFGSNIYGNASDQFTNCTVEQCYIRYAYNSFTCNPAGITGAVWNNTFINCRSDFAVAWGWYFNAIVGSTTQTWINCMIDGVFGGTSIGWHVNNVDDVSWLNCQADDIVVDATTDAAIYVNTATSINIQNFRSESSSITANGGRLFYLNGSAVIENVKVQASTFNPGPGNRATIIGLGTKGYSTIGSITLESCVITSGTFYKLDSNGLTSGSGRCIITGTDIYRSEVRADDTGDKTVYANKSFLIAPTGSVDPTKGNYEVGDVFRTATINGSSLPKISRVCITAGSSGDLTGVTGTITSGSTVLTVNTTTGLTNGAYITIAGVSGVKRIVHISGTNTVYISSAADASVAGAAVAFSAPVFKLAETMTYKGASASRPTAALSTSDVGVMYLDTTLDADGKPIWWNGAAWVDATGAIV